MSFVFTCLSHLFLAVCSEASRWKTSEAQVTPNMHTACAIIFILEERIATLYVLREVVSTVFCYCKGGVAGFWVGNLWVRGERRVWVELSAERPANECWIVCRETFFAGENGRVSENGEEWRRTGCCGVLYEKRRKIGNVSERRTTSTGACETTSACTQASVRGSRENLCLHCCPLVEKRVSFSFRKGLFRDWLTRVCKGEEVGWYPKAVGAETVLSYNRKTYPHALSTSDK